MDDFAGEDASGHQPVTIDEYLDELEEQELEADLVLGGDNGDECTYSKGYMKRQAIFSCLTCTPDGNAGVCTACSLSCHDGHEVVELWTKRNFRCDCGNSKFGEFICKLCPNKDVENVENAYNHNFKGVYCTCGRPYPDPENEDEQEMLQCCVCEDWFHRAHLGLESCDEIPRDEEDENLYEDLMCPACSATCSFLTLYPEKIWASTRKEDAAENAKKQKALIEEVHSESASTTKLDNGGSCSDPMKNYENDPVVGGSLCSKRDCIIGVDLGVAAPVIERTKPMFLAKGWREVLCQCEKCLKFYNEKRIGFLLEKEDSITEYEKMAKRKREENKEKQEASFPLNLLDNFGHVEKMEILHGIEELKNEIGNWLASRDHSKTVTAAEVQETFENIKKKRRREL